jgi:hypothetical protein
MHRRVPLHAASPLDKLTFFKCSPTVSRTLFLWFVSVVCFCGLFLWFVSVVHLRVRASIIRPNRRYWDPLPIHVGRKQRLSSSYYHDYYYFTKMSVISDLHPCVDQRFYELDPQLIIIIKFLEPVVPLVHPLDRTRTQTGTRTQIQTRTQTKTQARTQTGV